MMRRGTLLLLFAILPVACIIDGVPLPDETSNDSAEGPHFASGVDGVFVTRSSGVTLVFGVQSSVTGSATVIVESASREARTTASPDGSFNVALTGDLAPTITVSVVVGGAQVASTILDTPVAGNLLVPAGSSTNGDMAPAIAASSTRVDATLVTLSFPAGAFAGNVAVAIANIDRGTTEAVIAASDGSLTATVDAASGNTLYIIALADTGASAPYIVTVP